MFTEISTNQALSEVVNAAVSSGRYALDTEFHREKTYYPQLALIQICVDGVTYLIDPLEVDLALLGSLMRSDSLCVMHAGSQDLEILHLQTGAVPKNFMDTQIMAGFVGFSSPSLALLHEKFLGIEISKSDRLTDWLRRPLTDKQKAYAASDVNNLLQIYDDIADQLKEEGRLGWAREESAVLAEKYREGASKKEPISRIKEARRLSGNKRALAVALANWREGIAAKQDIPVRHVISDLAVTAIAQKAPRDEKTLRSIRGVEQRYLSNGKASQILEIVANPPEMEVTDRPSTGEVPKSLKPAVTLITTWLAQLAKNNDLDPALLATRADLEALLKEDSTSRLASGWRYDMAGQGITQLLEGQACISFDKDQGLLIEPRN